MHRTFLTVGQILAELGRFCLYFAVYNCPEIFHNAPSIGDPYTESDSLVPGTPTNNERI